MCGHFAAPGAMRTRRAPGAASWLGIIVAILTPGCMDGCRAPQRIADAQASLSIIFAVR